MAWVWQWVSRHRVPIVFAAILAAIVTQVLEDLRGRLLGWLLEHAMRGLASAPFMQHLAIQAVSTPYGLAVAVIAMFACVAGVIILFAYVKETILPRRGPIEVAQIGTVPDLPPPNFEMREMTATTATTDATMLVQVERLNPKRVYPFLRFAYALEEYDWSTHQVGNQNRAIHPKSPQMELDWDRYHATPPTRRPWFDFGVANYHEREPLGNVTLTVRFLGGGIRVAKEGDWIENRANEEYIYKFREPINAGVGLNGNGLLRVWFPRRERYMIRLTITAAGLPPVEQTLSVVLI